MMKYPKRHKNHSIEEESIIFLRSHLPKDWNVNSVDRDYGQDLTIEICEDGVYKGLELIVQMKSSFKSDNNEEIETHSMNVSTYNYLWDNLRIVMLIKYVKETKEAYWQLLKDVQSPNQENKTMTVNFPMENKISKLDWNDISNYVREITGKKLGSVRQ